MSSTSIKNTLQKENNSQLDEKNENKTESSSKSKSLSSNHKIRFFDKIVEEIGYGKEQILIIFVAGICFMTQGLYFFLNSGMFIPIQKYYEVKNSSMGISASMCYLSGIFITLLMGFLTHHIGRLRLIKLTLILTVIFHIFMSLTENFVIFCLCLVVIGACVNLNGPILTNILAEYLPIKNRAFTMGSIWGWYSLGNVFLLLVYWMVMPEYSAEKYVLVMNIFLFLPFLSLLLGFFLLKDSPRSMIINGDEKEGLLLLSKMYMSTKKYTSENRPKEVDQVFTDAEKQMIINELRVINKVKQPHDPNRIDFHISKQEDIGFFDMISKKYKLTTMLLSFIWILNSFVGYGPFFILPLTLSQIDSNQNIKTETEVEIIKSQLFVSLIGLISNPIGGFLCELPFVGRIKTGSFSAFFGFLTAILLLLDFNHLVTYMGILNITNTLVFNTAITYTSEIYPTYIRDYSSGVMNCLGNFGAMLSQPLYILYNYLGIKVPYAFTACFSVFTCVFFFLLPVETRGTELDYDDSLKEEEENKEKEGNLEENHDFIRKESLKID